jgi:hypothetical protein
MCIVYCDKLLLNTIPIINFLNISDIFLKKFIEMSMFNVIKISGLFLGKTYKYFFDSSFSNRNYGANSYFSKQNHLYSLAYIFSQIFYSILSLLFHLNQINIIEKLPENIKPSQFNKSYQSIVFN